MPFQDEKKYMNAFKVEEVEVDSYTHDSLTMN